MKSVIVIDLDGTLSNCDQRVNLAQMGEWEQFHEAGKDDPPHGDVVELLTIIEDRYHVILLSGRDSKYHGATVAWLNKWSLLSFIDEIILRPEGNYQSDHELKIQMLEDRLGGKERTIAKVAFVLDDRDKVVEAWRNYGLPCWQVRNGTY